ncbi:MAG: hypothetical protein JEZ14_25700 [Marinilabiliaceae bacterium]|nr:hypothetical protein [Marinilabiliaceae bacterium]
MNKYRIESHRKPGWDYSNGGDYFLTICIRNRFWHRNYHDHIIRDELEYQRIANYIVNNPRKWDQDKFKKR